MKRTILTLAILASMSLTSFASTDVLRKGGKDDFPKELKLSKDQKKQMESINKDFGDKIEAVKNSRIVKEVQDERIQKLREEKKEAINKMLTPEQQTEFAKKMPRNSKDRMERPGKVGDKEQRNKMRRDMFSDLDLTDTQKEQMDAVREKYSNDRDRSNGNFREEMKQILTPEQQAKLKDRRESMRDSRKNRRDEMQSFNKLDDAGKEKFKELKETYQKEKSAVERSRIAPDMQKMKLDILKEKFDKDTEELFKSIK